MIDKLLSFVGIKRERSTSEPELKRKIKNCICPICTDFIVNCVLTSCGHSFCEYCLNQSMTFSSLCPICRKGIGVSSYIPCKSIDFFIYSQLNDPQRKMFKLRKKETEKWRESKKLKNTKVGMNIDVLDTEGVWCDAIIKLKIDNGEKHQMLYIHYVGWDNSYDEIISESSHRLAPSGFYTSRNIPRNRLLQSNNP